MCHASPAADTLPILYCRNSKIEVQTKNETTLIPIEEFLTGPGTIAIDPQGIVRFSYKGTYWGDRPSIEQTLEMIKTQTFDFVHPKRLK